MPNPVFPPVTITTPQDTTMYEAGVYEDLTIRSETEGGYTLTRPRTTKKPRKTYKTGWCYLTAAQLTLLETFYETYGGWTILDWTDPATSTVKQVRFMSSPIVKYSGLGANRSYSVQVELQTV